MLFGHVTTPPGQLVMLQLPTFVPQSIRQLAPPAQLSVQVLLRLLPHCSQQVALPEQLRVPSSALSATAMHVEPPAQLKLQVFGPEQVKLQSQPLPGHDFEQLFPFGHDS